MDPHSIDPAEDEPRREPLGHPEDAPVPGAQRPMRVTPALAAALAGVFALETAWGGSEYVPTLVRMGALLPEGNLLEPWRLLSASLLHIGAMHLVLNLVALVSLGHLLERLLGPSRFLVLYVLSVLGGSVASAVFTGRVAAGASTGLWGLLVAEVIVLWRYSGLIDPSYVASVRGRSARNLVLNFGASFVGGVDLFGHLGGGFVGAALVGSGWLLRGLARGEAPPSSRALRRMATGAAIALGLAGLTAIGVGRPWVLEQPLEWAEQTWSGITLSLPTELGPLVPGDTGEDALAGDFNRGAGVVGITLLPYPEGPIAPEAVAADVLATEHTEACGGTTFRRGREPNVLTADCSSPGVRGEVTRWYDTRGAVEVTVVVWADAPRPWRAAIDEILASVKMPVAPQSAEVAPQSAEQSAPKSAAQPAGASTQPAGAAAGVAVDEGG